jgi:hypothetical protein
MDKHLHTIHLNHDAALLILGNQVVNGLAGTVTIHDYPGERPHRRLKICLQIGVDAICEVSLSAQSVIAGCRALIAHLKSIGESVGEYIEFESIVPKPAAG